ncbi:porin [Burkholderia singularis]|uniref:Porin n=1 Tax=Burkholderia singularis TaxID=1503053 RepID=A0A103E1L2_9BURK|nr:porin [Burkholderia singularis]KVE26643.1 porin [Burkholderia singularis]
MKKYAMTAASLAVMTSAHASDGGVTLSGLVDAGVSFISNKAGKRSLYFDDGIAVPNLWSLKGTEALGGDVTAIFELTSQYMLGNGAALPTAGSMFSRTAFVGLKSTRLGSVTFGQQYDFMIDTLTFGSFDGAFRYGGLYNFRQGPFAKLGIPDNPTGSFDFDRMAGSVRVPNAVKYTSANLGGLVFGALYGFGNQAGGGLSANSTVSAGIRYEAGAVSLGAAYVEVKYPQMNNGHDGLRNWGLGARYTMSSLDLNLLYTNTRNTLTGAAIDAIQAGASYVAAPWTIGANYEYMKGNAQLERNYAHQVTTAVQYALSKRTSAYVEGVYQYAGGGAGAYAWINGVMGPDAQSSTRSQFLARIGMLTRF